MNIFDKCVEQLEIWLLPSDANGLVAVLVTHEVPLSRIESAMFKGVAATKCGSVGRMVLRSALCSSFPMYAVLEMIVDGPYITADANDDHGGHLPPSMLTSPRTSPRRWDLDFDHNQPFESSCTVTGLQIPMLLSLPIQ